MSWLSRIFKRKPKPQFRVQRFPDGTILYWYGDELHPAYLRQLMFMHRKPDDNPFTRRLLGEPGSGSNGGNA